MEFTRYYDPDVDVNGQLTESSTSSYDDDHPEALASPIYHIGFVGVLGHFALLKTYCVVPIDGVLHHMYSSDLLALWGEAVFEASLHVYAASGATYQADREREFAAVSTLIENDCHGWIELGPIIHGGMGFGLVAWV